MISSYRVGADVFVVAPTGMGKVSQGSYSVELGADGW